MRQSNAREEDPPKPVFLMAARRASRFSGKYLIEAVEENICKNATTVIAKLKALKKDGALLTRY